ncbi:MAG: PEP-CTERM/exosortase system-associated acyltransferase [Nitrosospira sp.]|nr:PEP-CTERM/exosortase system-associated acyltransferase [Nitrosospira sp.]
MGSIFHQYFEIVPAFSSKLKNEVYRVRHQVYCEDLTFEPVRPDGLETDEHDSNALHLLMRSLKTGEFIGCTRIVRPRPADSHYRLPFEKTCATALDRAVIDPEKLPRHRIAEVSRLAVIASYRRRKGEASSPISLPDEDLDPRKSPRFPYIPLGLYLGTTELARRHGIDTLFVLTERRLANHFSKLGVKLQIIGEAVEHRGERVPAVMDVNSIISEMRNMFRSLYRAIASDIERGAP